MATSSGSGGLKHRHGTSRETKELQKPPEEGDGGHEPVVNHASETGRREGPDKP